MNSSIAHSSTSNPPLNFRNPNQISPSHSVIMEPAHRMIIPGKSRNEIFSLRNRSAINYELLKSESERLQTFSNAPIWPVSFIQPSDCARAGFFFLHDGDKVQCAFCRGVAGEWEEGDVPMTEHRRHFPRCPFVCNLPVGNIPIGGEMEDTSVSSEDDESQYGLDVAGPFDPQSLHINFLMDAPSEPSHQIPEETNSALKVYKGPHTPHMVTEQSRIKSYKEMNWSVELTGQKPGKLAEAGFYYVGSRDHVKCYCCGGGLRNWVAEDDPWVEHAKFFPRCTFIQLNKSEDFIKHATESGKSSKSQLTSCASSDSTETEASFSSSCSSNGSSRKNETIRVTNDGHSSGYSSGSEGSDNGQDLEEEVRRLREDRQCKICLDKERSVVFVPCGHLISCISCATAFSSCAICRKPIESIVKTYMS